MEVCSDNTKRILTFQNVLHVPTFKHNLLSMRLMWKPKEGFDFVRDKGALILKYQGQPIVRSDWDSVPVMVGMPVPAKLTVTVGSDGPTGAVKLGKVQGLSPGKHGGAKALLGNVSGSATAKLREAAMELHRSMGHPSHRVLADGISKGQITGTDVKAEDVLKLSQCEPCIAGKMRRSPFPESSRKDSHGVGEVISID